MRLTSKKQRRALRAASKLPVPRKRKEHAFRIRMALARVETRQGRLWN